jgi:hypothetical protein
MIARGKVDHGQTLIEWMQPAPEPEAFVVEKDHYDNMAASIEVVGGKWYVMIREVHPCNGYEHAERTLDALIAMRTKDFSESAFDGGPVDASEWPFQE